MALIRGTVAAYATGSATVRLEGSSAQTIVVAKVSLGLTGTEGIGVGKKVLVETGDHNDPADFVIIAAWA